MSYFIMDKYGDNLLNYYQKLHGFSKKTIFQLGIRLIDALERIHEAGYVFNDLKLDNVLIGNHKNSESSLHKIRLCDFGFALKYRDHNGKHLKQTDVDAFRSNMIFATSS